MRETEKEGEREGMEEMIQERRNETTENGNKKHTEKSNIMTI